MEEPWALQPETEGLVLSRLRTYLDTPKRIRGETDLVNKGRREREKERKRKREKEKSSDFKNSNFYI